MFLNVFNHAFRKIIRITREYFDKNVSKKILNNWVKNFPMILIDGNEKHSLFASNTFWERIWKARIKFAVQQGNMRLRQKRFIDHLKN